MYLNFESITYITAVAYSHILTNFIDNFLLVSYKFLHGTKNWLSFKGGSRDMQRVVPLVALISSN